MWVLLQALLLTAIFCLGIAFRNSWSGSALVLIGSLLLLAAATCGVLGTIALGRNLTPFPKPGPDNRLVQSGIYRHLRHPLYTAVFCGAVGWALLWRSWPALLASLALGLFFDTKARREERWLKQRHPEYGEYQRRAARFLPWIY